MIHRRSMLLIAVLCMNALSADQVAVAAPSSGTPIVISKPAIPAAPSTTPPASLTSTPAISQKPSTTPSSTSTAITLAEERAADLASIQQSQTTPTFSLESLTPSEEKPSVTQIAAPPVEEAKSTILAAEEPVVTLPSDMPTLVDDMKDAIINATPSTPTPALSESATAKPEIAVGSLQTNPTWDVESFIAKEAAAKTSTPTALANAPTSTPPSLPAVTPPSIPSSTPVPETQAAPKLDEDDPAIDQPLTPTEPKANEADAAMLETIDKKREAVKPAAPAFSPATVSISAAPEATDASPESAEKEAAAEQKPEGFVSQEESEKSIKEDEQTAATHKEIVTAEMKFAAEAAQKQKEAFNMQLSALIAAGVDVDENGFAFTGKLNLWGDQYIKITASVNQHGLLAQGYMNEINLGPLKITGTGPDGVYGTPDDGVIVEMRINKDIQQIMASGLVTLLGAQARAELLFGTSGVTFFTHLKLLDAFEAKFLAESRGSGKDLDFVVQGALEADFMEFLEKEGVKAIDFLTQTTTKGLKEAQTKVNGIQDGISKIRTEIKSIRAKFYKSQAALDKKTKAANVVLGPPRALVAKLDKQLEKIKSEIWALRRKFIEGRKKALAAFETAQRKIKVLDNDCTHAAESLKSAKKKAKWYKPWTYAVVAYWATRYAVVKAIYLAAATVLRGLKAATNIFPLDLTPPLPVLWAAYGQAKIALFAALEALTAARLATNPLAITDFADMARYGIEIAGLEATIAGMQGALTAAKASLEVAMFTVQSAGDLVSEAIKLTAMAGDLFPLRLIGAAYKFSLREVATGKLPTLGLIAKVFGKKKTLVLNLDLKDPKNFALAFPKLLLQALNPRYAGPDFMAQIESTRAKYKGELAAIEAQTKGADANKKLWEDKIKQSEDAKQRILEQGKAEAAAAEGRMMKEGGDDIEKETEPTTSGELALGADGEENPNKELFNPANPSIYEIRGRQFLYNWNDQWVLPAKNSGSILFEVVGSENITIGLHTTKDGKPADRTYQIIIGQPEQGGTIIQKIGTGGSVQKLIESRDSAAQATSIGAGDTNQYPYWVSYHEGYIACGKGKTAGENLIVEWLDTAPPATIKYYSFSCDKNSLSFSEIRTAPAFSRPFGGRYSLFEGLNNFIWHEKWLLPQKGGATITFLAKAAREIKVGFSDDTTTAYADYIVNIGMDDNSQSSITEVSPDGKDYTHQALTKDPDALIPGDGTNFVPYWIVYNKGHLCFGRGTEPGKDVALEWLDRSPLPGLSYCSFSCWDNPVELQNIVIAPPIEVKIGSKYSAVNRNFTFEWRPEWVLTEKDKGLVRFRTKGREAMVFGLHTEVGKANEYTYQLIIGAENNTKTILKDASGTILTATTDPDTLIPEVNNYNDFWVQYDNGYIILGSGEPATKQVVFEYQAPKSATPITHFAFSNSTDYVEFQRIDSLPIIAVSRAQIYAITNQKNRFVWQDAWQLPVAGNGLIYFDALAKDSLIIGLHTKLDTPEKRTFDIVLGANNNSESVIRDSSGAPLSRERGRKSLLPSGTNYTSYWVSLNQGILAAGTGKVAGENSMVSCTMEESDLTNAIKYFSFSCQDSPITYRAITAAAVTPSASSAATPIASTPEVAASGSGDASLIAASYIRPQSLLSWKDSWRLAEKDRDLILFNARGNGVITNKVTTFQPMFIGLHTDAGASDGESTYGIRLDGTQGAITKAGASVYQSTESRLLDIDNFYDYWLYYDHGYIGFGGGTTPGRNILLEWTDPFPRENVQYLAMAGAQRFRNIRHASIPPAYQRHTTYTAPIGTSVELWPTAWNFATPDNGSIKFFLRTAGGATVFLGKEKTTRYGITLGSDNLLHLTYGSSELTTAPYTKPSATKALPFWVNYDNKHLSFGSGEIIGENVLLEANNTRVAAGIEGFSFGAIGQPAFFSRITKDTAATIASFSTYTATALNGMFDWKPSWSTPKPDSFTISFKARGEDNIYVGLNTRSTATGAIGTERAYDIIIGEGENARTVVRNSKQEIIGQTTAITASSEESTAYWITYNNGVIRIGASEEIGDGQTLSIPLGRAEQGISQVSFSSKTKTVVFTDIKIQEAVIKEDSDDSAISVPALNGACTWSPRQTLPAAGSGALIFSTQAEQGILVGLSSKATGAPEYALTIGNNNNTETTLSAGGLIVGRTTDQRALIKSKYTTMTWWLNYANGVLTFGAGSKVGEQELLSWTSPASQPVKFYALSSLTSKVDYSAVSTAPGVERPRYSAYYAQNSLAAPFYPPEWEFAQTGSGSFTLSAAGVSDMLFCLHTMKRGNPTYVVTIGGENNTKGTIEKISSAGYKKVFESPTALLPKAAISLTYWFTYKEGRILVGKGDPGQGILIDWTDPESKPAINNVMFGARATPVAYSSIAQREVILPAATPADPVAAQKLAVQQAAAEQKQLAAQAAAAQKERLADSLAAARKAQEAASTDPFAIFGGAAAA